jgi:hypothetical protein
MCFMETYVVRVNRLGQDLDVAKRNPGELAVRTREPGLCCTLSKLGLLTPRNWVHKWQSYIAPPDVEDAKRTTRWKLPPGCRLEGLKLSFRLRISSVAPLSHGKRCR